jgi:hypothetical protein
MADLTKLFDSTDASAARASAKPTAAPAAAKPAATQAAAPATSRPVTEAERLARFYDAPDTTVGGRREAPPDRRAAADRERLSSFYDSPEAVAARGPDGADGKPTGPDAAAAPIQLQAPEGTDPKSAGWQEFSAAARELGLDAKGSQRLLQLH